MSTMQPPLYFQAVKERARWRWGQLEADPELAGPWNQLFRQVQSPRHVVSELLQNADDVGAKRVRVSIHDGQFAFEHDGKDFNKDEFASLCRFGFSNKRKLHTIGFRGIGFKSTFSLGDVVEVLTPTLAVRFHSRRFTEPEWVTDASPCDATRISVKIQDCNREQELRKNLEDWAKNPTSLLFFNSVNELTIDGVTVRKERMGPGPVARSERIRLIGREQQDVMVIASPEEAFPPEAIDEIRQERNVDDLHLVPCRVELILGLPGDQRLYVVLPTGVVIKTPFSCNAPFLQDPVRSIIKAPSLSPTNRWLLQRLGRLAGSAMLEWLRNECLEVDVRAQAYKLMPAKPHEKDSLEADVTRSICQGFVETVGDQPVLLTTTGRLVDSKKCVAPPARAYAVWTPAQLLEVFGDGAEHVLSEAVAETHRQCLESWGWLDNLNVNSLIERLTNGQSIPRPTEYRNIVALWSLVQQCVHYDYGGRQRRRLAIVPVEGIAVLLTAENVVRLPMKKEALSDTSWAFLVALVHIIDPGWVQYLGKTKGDEKTDGAAQLLLRDLNLDRPSDTSTVVARACSRLFGQDQVTIEDHVRIAHVIAALDAKTPDEFRCITRDGEQRKMDHGIIATQDSRVEELLPEDWASSHLLHDAYFSTDSVCTRQQWGQWIRSDKSGFWPFAPIRSMPQLIWSRKKLAKTLESRGAAVPTSFPYEREKFALEDYDFAPKLVDYWETCAATDAKVWTKVGRCILQAPSTYWQNRCEAKLCQVARNGYWRSVTTEQSIPAAWIVRLRGLRCLPDTRNESRVPAELYLRTPETEPLLGVEPFVSAELDTEATKPLLRLLGVRDTPAGLDKLIERIRALSRVLDPRPLLSEILNWYGALDKALVRCDADDMAQVRKAFAGEPLVLTAECKWAKASEVFQYASEDDIPDAPVVHPAANSLGMWARLGVAERPTVDRVLGWLKGLPSGEPLEPNAVGRVRAALRRYPVQVWQTCQHWLALDNAWVPVERLRFRLTMHSLTRWADLFPSVKAATADLQMLSTEVCDRQPFTALADLGAMVEYRLTHHLSIGQPGQKPWCTILAQMLARVTLPDEDETRRIRATAVRLARSVWQPVDDGDSIQVTPYLDNAPAGQGHCPNVLWFDHTIFVRERRVARSFGDLVAELAKPFANPAVREAIKACIERGEDFVREYMEEHFTLEAEPPLPNLSDAEGQCDGGGHESGGSQERDDVAIMEGADGEEWGEPADAEWNGEAKDEEVEVPRRHKRQPTLFERFACGAGYRWDAISNRFIHPDGSWIEHANSPFPWWRYDLKGNLMTRYWVSQQCLTGGGVEIPAEVWELLKQRPSEYAIIILADNPTRLRELRGPNLCQMVERKVIELYPAKYRLREASKG